MSQKYIETIFKTLEDGEKRIGSNENKNITLLLGSSDSDKITLAHVIGNEGRKLKSTENTHSYFDIPEYIIVDSESNKALVDDKYYPELIHNEAEDMYIFNCPPFDKYRSYDKDIALAYLTKKVLNESISVKLILVLNYLDIKYPNFNDLARLFNYFYLFLYDLEKYKNSIGLVVNQVEQNIGYSTVVNGVVKYLQSFKNLKTNYVKNEGQNLFYNKLIDILTKKDENKYKRINIFNKPNKPGDIVDDEILIQSQNWIKTLINNEISFTLIDTSDFGNFLSDNAKETIQKLSINLNMEFAKYVGDICKFIQTELERKKEHSESFHDLYDSHIKDHTTLTEYIKEIQSYTRPKIFIAELMKLLHSLKIEYSKTLFDDLYRVSNYYNYFESISDKTFDEDITSWTEPLREISIYLKKQSNLYSFLYDLYNFLSSYNVLSNKHIYNVGDIKKFGITEEKEKHINITLQNLQEFLNRIKEMKIFHFNIDSKDFVPKDLFYLNQILSATVGNHVKVHVKDNQMFLEGDYVILSQIVNMVYAGEKLFNDINELTIQAFQTIFIDDDIEKIDEQMKIIFIAPKWEIMGNRKFNLNGRDGGNRMGKATDYQHGLPGFPGTPGGCIFGIAEYIINRNNLEITANGGNGGNAQDGGNGRHNPGGNGGKRGFGGPAGCIDIFIISEKKKLNAIPLRGKDGKPGKGGFGARTGLSDYHTTGNITSLPAVKITDIPTIINTYKSKLRNNLLDSLKTKKLLSFSHKIDNTEIIHEIYNTLDFIDDFKKIENDRYTYKDKNIDFIPFYDSLINRIEKYTKNIKRNENNDDYKKILNFLYSATLSTKSLISNTSLGTLIIDIMKYFDIIIGRMNKFEEEQNLMLLIQERIQSNYNYNKEIKQSIEDAIDIITNIIKPEMDKIEKELDEQIEGLKKEIKELQKMAVEEKEKLEQKKRQLEAAQCLKLFAGVFNFIGSILTIFVGPVGSVFNTVGNIIQTEADMLGKQHIPEINLPSGIMNALYDKKGIENLKLKPILFNPRMKRSAISYKNIQHINKTTETNVLEKLLSDRNSTYKTKISKYSKNLEFNNLKQYITTAIKGTYNNSLVDKESNYKQSNITDDLSEDLKLIDKSSGVQNHVQNKTYSEPDIIEFNNSVIDFQKYHTNSLDIEQKRVKRDDSNETKIIDANLKFIENTYNVLRTGQSDIDEVNDRIEQVKQKIKQLDAYAEYVDKTLQPLLKNMHKDVKDFQESLQTQTKTQLIVSKWKVQSTLKDMKLNLKPILVGFKISDKIQRSMEKLEEVTNTIINVYDQIQQYQEQRKLIDYISEITSPTYVDKPIKDTELLKIYNELDKILKGNEIFYHYQLLLSNYRRHVFPFSDTFTDIYSELYKLKETSLVDFVKKIKQKTEQLKFTYEKDKYTTGNNDNHIIETSFNSNTTTKPFYVWSNDLYQDEFKKLFNGEKIFLKSDVTQSRYNSVKFQNIQVKFKTSNNLQDNLNKILNDYDINLIHFGNSYYKCNDKYYIISHNKLNLIYSYQHSNNEPVTYNKIYTKILKGDISLSPYAMWSLQLENKDSNNFSDLKRFVNKVDIELIGKGIYVKHNCDKNLNKYYKEIDELYINSNDNYLIHNEQYRNQNRNKRFVNSTTNIIEIQTPLNSNTIDITKTKSSLDETVTPHLIDVREVFDTTTKDLYYSSSSRITSPINNIINWIKINIILQSINSIGQIKQYFTQYTSDDTKYMSEPHKFYNDVDNALILAPVLIHLWKKYFNKTANNNQHKFIKKSSSRLNMWTNIIEQEENLLDLLRNNSDIIWYEDILENQKETIDYLECKTKWDDSEVVDFEKSLIAFNIDLFEDIKYGNFKFVKNNNSILKIINNISSMCEILPNYKKLIKHIQVCDDNQSYVNNCNIKNTYNAFQFTNIYSYSHSNYSYDNLTNKTSLNLLE